MKGSPSLGCQTPQCVLELYCPDPRRSRFSIRRSLRKDIQLYEVAGVLFFGFLFFVSAVEMSDFSLLAAAFFSSVFPPSERTGQRGGLCHLLIWHMTLDWSRSFMIEVIRKLSE